MFASVFHLQPDQFACHQRPFNPSRCDQSIAEISLSNFFRHTMIYNVYIFIYLVPCVFFVCNVAFQSFFNLMAFKLDILLKLFPMIPLNCVNWLWAEKRASPRLISVKDSLGPRVCDGCDVCDDYLNTLETDALRYIHHNICKVYNHNTSE